ncbi:hypothetical protein [Streptacidiphilus jiangxiensis]|uniref:Uncharacterized protein n=1 Tax=Streptacidiphilus jiangxiensis TaxID=235985 RepID=A0A1H7ZF82_STRJI|nr:hypothetical protein [Streptacidiphilus jiangxiensis]SEM56179.1 hypothetical protein SAMN05414137_13436 [Streptacidiphilus jiangxiensis]
MGSVETLLATQLLSAYPEYLFGRMRLNAKTIAMILAPLAIFVPLSILGVVALARGDAGGRGGKEGLPPAWFWGSLLVGLGVALVGGAGLATVHLRTVRRREATLEVVKIREAEEEALKKVLSLENLFALNQKQIADYHLIATVQAAQSFRSARLAMWAGLGVIVACCSVGLIVQAAEAKVFLGAVAAVGAALSGYLNRTYLNMYGQTLAQLNRFFEQPVLSSSYLTAERLAKGLSDDPESEVRRQIVAQVLAASAQMSKSPAAAKVPTPRRSRRTVAADETSAVDTSSTQA